MILCLGDSALGLVVRMCGFVRLHFYLAAHDLAGHDLALHGAGAGSGNPEAMADLVRSIAGTTENLGGIAFGLGSALFFYLFFRSRYLPRVIATLGVAASVIWVVLYFASLLFPERHATFQLICFPPMLLGEVLTGFYLLLFGVGVRTAQPTDRAEPTMPA
jgi:hypothetical protein